MPSGQRLMRSVVVMALLALSLPLAAVTQEAGILRISVVLTDADGHVTPIPRVVLLVSHNPATNEPQRVRTGADGTVEIALPPGNYTVESDLPITLGGQSYIWTQMLDVTGGPNVLALTPANAEITSDTGGPSRGAASMSADSAAIFNKWRHSIVEIWTPTRHASGFVIDARGLIATNDRAIGDATEVEVEFSGSGTPGATAPNRIKVPGRVMAADPRQGVAIVWIDPATIASIPVVAPDCSGAATAAAYEQKVVTIVAPLLEPKNAILGTVGRVEPPSFYIDWSLTGGSAGGPVFDASGRPVGLTLADEPRDDARRRDSQAIALSNACSVLAAAEKKMAGLAPPAATRLRVEDSRTVTPTRKPADPKAAPPAIPTLSSSSFDVALSTPALIQGDPSQSSPRTDFGSWTDYVNSAPPVLLVRVTPQFEESVWKTLMRGAAMTQGIGLPPLKSFSANFLRLRAYCGALEVLPIHPFTIEREVQGRASIREGLYVFAVGDFGAQCATVRFDLYSEKSPDRADALTVDPKLFAQISGIQ